ncbi:MAG: DUF4339 domain-containing protein [Bdellovibrionaceae bacterium]|nr:DUF4339 domain-containing protein [Pseudobdellovibrionaceae bacterium]
MSAKLHPVSRNGETLGPWSVEQIAEQLASGGVAITDFVWDSADWVPLMEFAELKAHLQSKRPKAPPQTAGKAESPVVSEPSVMPSIAAAPSMKPEDALIWYVSRGQQKFGPFNYFGVIKALQDKSIFEFDYVWKEGTENWIRLAEHELFSQEKVRELLAAATPTLAAIFAKRQHERVKIQTDVLVNDNMTMSPGQLVEIGAGGAGLIVKNAKLMPGQLVNIHIASTDELPAFNAVGEIVSKKFERAVRNTRAPIQYGIRYVKVDRVVEERVKDYCRSLRSARQTA